MSNAGANERHDNTNYTDERHIVRASEQHKQHMRSVCGARCVHDNACVHWYVHVHVACTYTRAGTSIGVSQVYGFATTLMQLNTNNTATFVLPPYTVGSALVRYRMFGAEYGNERVEHDHSQLIIYHAPIDCGAGCAVACTTDI